VRTDLRVAARLRPASDSSMPPAKKLKITALAGGVGASKLLLGLYEVMDPRLLTIIVNTGDDIVLHGLKISPDLDIVTYTLAGIVDAAKGWGFRGETFHALKRLAAFGRPNWFNLGDRDLATHIHRTALLAEGKTLSQAADSIRTALGVKSRILPMSDNPVPTIIDSSEGPLHFQEYLVKRRAEPIVKKIRFAGVESARPAPGVLEAIRAADRILICPGSARNSARAKREYSPSAPSSAANPSKAPPTKCWPSSATIVPRSAWPNCTPTSRARSLWILLTNPNPRPSPPSA
jgi:2-phospho-L-lactate transferase/gluconeogenesis factor (CofD/UPF0052 family)